MSLVIISAAIENADDKTLRLVLGDTESKKLAGSYLVSEEDMRAAPSLAKYLFSEINKALLREETAGA